MKIRNILQNLLPENSFVRGVTVISGGALSAQLLMLFSAPILTRLYSPEEFGFLAVFISILSILGVITSLRYEFAIPIAGDDKSAINIVVLCILITSIITIIAITAVWLGGSWFANLLKINDYVEYLWFLPVSIFLIGLYKIFNYWAVREKAFGRISVAKLMQAVSALTIQFSFFSLGVIGLVIGYIVGQFFGTNRLSKSFIQSYDKEKINFQGIISVLLRYSKFPKFSTWGALINSSGHQLAPIILVSFFGMTIAGWYALANRVVSMPAIFFGNALGNVFFAHAAEAKHDGKLTELVENVQSILIVIALPISILILILGAELFAWIFGDEWEVAGEFAQWLALSSLMGFLTSSLSLIFPVLEKQGLALILQIILFVLRFCGLFIGLIFNDYLLAVMLYALGGVLGYGIYVVAISLSSGARLNCFIRNFVTFSFFSLVIYSPIIMNKYFYSKDTINYYFVLFSGLMFVVYYIFTIKKLYAFR